MLTAEGCAARRQRLWQALAESCDALIIADLSHLTYFANYVQSPFVFRANDARPVLILEPDRAVLVADNLLESFAETAWVDEVIAPTWYEGRRSAPHRPGRFVHSARQWLGTRPAGRIGVEMATVPVGLIEGLGRPRSGPELVDLDPIIRRLRRSKDADEVEVLRRSMRAIEAGQAAALEQVEPGMIELDVFRIVQEAAIREAGQPAMVYGDFASGPRTMQGGPPSDRTIAPGDLFLLDVSVVIHGYRGDLTNTFAVGAEPSDRQRALADACLEALKAAEGWLKPGTPARAIDRAIRDAFAAKGLEATFTTHSGHGVGLGHPEPPFLVPESDDTLVVGDVVAVEPGQYVEGVGGLRFEHNYRITSEGFETLSQHRLTLAN